MHNGEGLLILNNGLLNVLSLGLNLGLLRNNGFNFSDGFLDNFSGGDRLDGLQDGQKGDNGQNEEEKSEGNDQELGGGGHHPGVGFHEVIMSNGD